MPITDKTRKLLWGRSGNRCAICRKSLVVNASSNDDESIVGEECHIISSRPNGPRYDASFPVEKLDGYDNLILLCRVDHKAVDDQATTFTAEILRQEKVAHEEWVSGRLDEQKPRPIQFRRLKQNIPEFIHRITTGNELLETISNCLSFDFGHDELRSQEEVDLIGEFLQVAQDWGDISDELEAGGRVQVAFNLGKSLTALEQSGFFVFGGREVQLIEGGISQGPSNWPVAILRVLRKDNPSIIQVDRNDITTPKPPK